jgi:hypothetical protein
MATYFSPEQSEQRRLRRRSAADTKLAVAGRDLVPKAFEGSPSEHDLQSCSRTAQLSVKGKHMKISVIAWHLFWEAVRNQRVGNLDQWLRRWVFDDDGVRLSMKPGTEPKVRSTIHPIADEPLGRSLLG